MKIGIIGDIHWSTRSSIINSRGSRYSTRLENLVKSVNWAEATLDKLEVDSIVYLGDFFDKSVLSAEEITSLNDLSFSSKLHYILVGNHEMTDSHREFNTVNLLKHLISNSVIIDKPMSVDNIHFIPYIVDEEDRDLDKLIDLTQYKSNLIFSHNDVKGMQLGPYTSTQGFDLHKINNDDRIELFINGHLHNHYIDNKICNVGNLTGQNFSEDAFKYKHQIMTYDTDMHTYEFIENPYAMNFYKITSLEDLNTLSDNAVIEFINDENTVKAFLQSSDLSKYIAYRTHIKYEKSNTTDVDIASYEHIDYTLLFTNFCKEKLSENIDELTLDKVIQEIVCD